jgi:predicted nucleotidyltransferase
MKTKQWDHKQKGGKNMLNRQAMRELKELLLTTFPNEIEQVILFGSQVKGTAQEYSDYDVLIILKHTYDWQFKNKIYDTTWEIDFKHDILTDVKLISKSELQTLKGKQPFIQDALEEGVIL